MSNAVQLSSKYRDVIPAKARIQCLLAFTSLDSRLRENDDTWNLGLTEQHQNGMRFFFIGRQSIVSHGNFYSLVPSSEISC
jgi:hypothetical protein